MPAPERDDGDDGDDADERAYNNADDRAHTHSRV